MATAEDDDIPRSWVVYCMDKNTKQVLGEEVNNTRLCKGKTGNVICNEYDKQIYGLQMKKKCHKLRFEQTGKNSSFRDYFVLSGVELFGNLYRAFSFFTLNECNMRLFLSPLFFTITIQT